MTQLTPTPRANDYKAASFDLKSWASAFKLTVDDVVEAIDEIVKDDYQLGDVCPTKYAAAEINFRQIMKKKRELDSAIVDFEKAFSDAVS